MLLKCGVLLLAVAVLPFQIPLETVYTSTESHIQTQARLIRGDTSLYNGDAAIVTTLNVSILYTHIQPDPFFFCNPTEGYITEKGKFGREELCGRYQEMTIIINDLDGTKDRFNITVFNVVRHSVQIVTPRVKFHLGIAYLNDTSSTFAKLGVYQYAFLYVNNTYILTDEFNHNDYNLEDSTGWDYEPGTPYHYYEIELTGIYIEGYQSYSTFNDNLVLFDTGIGYMEFYSDRFNEFFSNFVETYCDDNREQNSQIRCNCEGKNFNNLPQIRWAINNKYYELGPDNYLFDAYIDRDTYITWCELGIKDNEFTTNIKTDFNVIGSLFFREYSVAVVQDPKTFKVQIGVMGGSQLSRVSQVINSSILYAVIVVLLCVLVLWLSLRRHRRLKFEEAIKLKDPTRYYQMTSNVETKHLHRLEANMGNIDHTRQIEEDQNDIDPKMLQRIEKDAEIQLHVKQQAIKRQKTQMRPIGEDLEFD